MENTLYYGDNLDVMRRHIKDETVDLVYLDPPFNSNTNYNVLFAEKNGSQAASQIQAFTDTWTWNQESEAVYADLGLAGGRVSDCLQAFRTFLGVCDMLAYLVMMAPRLVELRRVLKPTGSIYLHCDPTASHYLKMLMDAVFGPVNFCNEVIWKRTSAHNDPSRYGKIHDVLLFYAKSKQRKWNTLYTPYSEEYLKAEFRPDKTGELVKYENLTAPSHGSDSGRDNWRGVTPPSSRMWSCSLEKREELYAQGRIKTKPDGTPIMRGLKTYLKDIPGVPLQDLWIDIGRIGNTAPERLHYQTQKPIALLERIIRSSCPEGGVVLDPFCGCGTTIAAAQKLGRPWIGIDITHLAITLIKQRLIDSFGIEPIICAVSPKKAEALRAAEASAEYGEPMKRPFHVVGEPTSLPDAEILASSDKYQFQWWALGLVGARPTEQKKGADSGIDGKISFQGDKVGVVESVIISVKAGENVNVTHVRDLLGVLNREKAAIGVLVSMQEPTAPMRKEAVTAGFYESTSWGQKYPRVQLLTIAELLAGTKKVDMPPIRQVDATFKKSPKVIKKQGEQQELPMRKKGKE